MKLIKTILKMFSKLLSLIEYHLLWPLIFGLYKIFIRQDKKCVLFADSYSCKLTDNMEPIYATLKSMGGFELFTCFPSNDKTRKLSRRFERDKTHLKFLKLYAKCGTLFLSESFLPVYAVHARHGTNIIQLWHGCGAFKKWGYSTLNSNFGADEKTVVQFPMHNCYTLVPVSSAICSEHYADAFRCNQDIIKPIGVPRTDIYFDKDFVSSSKLNLYNLCPQIKSTYTASEFSNKTLILYAPTFRGNTITDAASSMFPDFSILNDKDVVFLCRLHPFVKGKVKTPTNVIDISIAPTDIALCASDILITDYSSIIFEYSLTGRPMIFYAYDLDAYELERGFYEPYSEFVPGRIAKSENDLIEEIKNTLGSTHSTITTEFAKKYMNACDGHSTEKIIQSLWG